MKPNIHPDTRLVIFEDAQTKRQYLIESSIATKEKRVFEEDGKEYPFYNVDVSADSHPFYTGSLTFVQAQGRVERFNRRYGINKEEKTDK